jgi:uncharacterized membrane protein YhaH (DUF805 family)
MGFGAAISTCFRKYVDFGDRAKRSEYWYWTLFSIILSIFVSILDAIEFGKIFAAFSLVASLGLLLPTLAVTVRRLHDIDHSGWWILIGLVPLIGIYVLLLFACRRGTPGPNRFGSDL